MDRLEKCNKEGWVGSEPILETRATKAHRVEGRIASPDCKYLRSKWCGPGVRDELGQLWL